jgi:hypothetical protein
LPAMRTASARPTHLNPILDSTDDMNQRIALDDDSMRRLIEGLAERLSEIAKQPAPFLKPPQIAKMLGVKTDKVLLWIRNAELKAINVAATQGIGSRPRYRVSSKDLDSFLLRRAVMLPPQVPRRRRMRLLDAEPFFGNAADSRREMKKNDRRLKVNIPPDVLAARVAKIKASCAKTNAIKKLLGRKIL